MTKVNSSDTTERELDLLVVGDANPDLILYGGEIEPAFGQRERIVGEAALVLGGSGSITAAGAARLGLRTAIVSCVGDDTFGRFTLDQLAARGVGTGAVRVLDELPTAVSVALARPHDRAVLTALGTLGAMSECAVPDTLLHRTRHVHIASPFLQPQLGDGLAALVNRAHAAGATVSLDTGWDPEDRWASVAEALSLVDLLLPNAQESVRLARVVDGPGSASPSSGSAGPVTPDESREAALRLAAGGPLVAVKLGAHGAVAVRDGVVVHVDAPKVHTVDATGAGDSFDAGFLLGWLGGADLAHSLALGCACGALSTRSAGGTAGQPTRGEAEKMAGAVTA
ncbi:sugar kinase [Amycolatopsis acidiphila]|uniref:Sugar kinase n=1 Tax=Amycolatopsis acidiphila TaxID=715473 RepID=A0A558AIJ7_9PSEU|nr:sugar kinase [Amycolatopsis acidiphila]TVT24090.1 sugar kinase [Amycolatopsis acidiphila]UIJ57755.1 sugar kinase [Amycolatopsis acidiphila]GHG87500.1 ribokinase [Amycolatopsis acidiphila]